MNIIGLYATRRHAEIAAVTRDTDGSLPALVHFEVVTHGSGETDADYIERVHLRLVTRAEVLKEVDVIANTGKEFPELGREAAVDIGCQLRDVDPLMDEEAGVFSPIYRPMCSSARKRKANLTTWKPLGVDLSGDIHGIAAALCVSPTTCISKRGANN